MTDVIAKVNALDAHDRFTYLQQEQSDMVRDGYLDCFNNNPDAQFLKANAKYLYIFAHTRTREDGNKRLLWQPRLTKPKAQTNSMLFRADTKEPDLVNIIWMIPDRGQWGAYMKGKMFQHEIVVNSIKAFQESRKRMEAPENGDLDDAAVRRIYALKKLM